MFADGISTPKFLILLLYFCYYILNVIILLLEIEWQKKQVKPKEVITTQRN